MARRLSLPAAFRVRHPRTRTFLWMVVAALVFGTVEFGEPLEDALRIGRNAVRAQPASGEIVLVAIDDESLEKTRSWPWPRRYHAALVDRLFAAGAKSVHFSVEFAVPSAAEDDRMLRDAIARNKGKVSLAARFRIDPRTGERTDMMPMAPFREAARVVNVNFRYNFQGAVWNVPFSATQQGEVYPGLAVQLAAFPEIRTGEFQVDYSIDPSTIPQISAARILAGDLPPAAVAGKDVVIGVTAAQYSEGYFLPGHGRRAAVFVHLVAAETLKKGVPASFGWIPPFLLALALTAGLVFARRRLWKALSAAARLAILLVAPISLDAASLHVQVMPGLFLLIVACVTLGWTSLRDGYRRRARSHAVSGLPNLAALREDGAPRDHVLVAARIHNYAEICTSLGPVEEQDLAEQIASRLGLGTPLARLYHGDEGVFAWFAPPDLVPYLQDHLEAMHALFRAPAIVSNRPVDLSVSFGIEAGGEGSVVNRLGSALVAADEAASEAKRWKRYDSDKLKDAPWRLSILSQLEAAIESGDLWVAYQPKLELGSGRIVGAEALVRWTHPEKGPISPMEFIAAAEQHGRIGNLTQFVLDRAVRAAAFINGRGLQFGVSVNLSAKLLDQFGPDLAIAELLDRHRLRPGLLTLEVTETAALATGAADMEALHRLRTMGVQISIDDYGTGLSTLEYLRKIPATEIKIDQSFVQSIYRSHGDKLMVHSTIQLAHSLGQKVVAEGVEDLQTLEALAFMDCDMAQGFFIARPMPFRDLVRLLRKEGRRRVA